MSLHESIGVVRASSLRLRAGAGVSFDVVRGLPRGTRVKVVGHEGDWLQVVAGDDEGFLHSDFVRLEAAEDADPSHHTFFHADSGLAEFALPAADPVSDRANASARDKRLRAMTSSASQPTTTGRDRPPSMRH